jgi:hypothetical protein
LSLQQGTAGRSGGGSKSPKKGRSKSPKKGITRTQSAESQKRGEVLRPGSSEVDGGQEKAAGGGRAPVPRDETSESSKNVNPAGSHRALKGHKTVAKPGVGADTGVVQKHKQDNNKGNDGRDKEHRSRASRVPSVASVSSVTAGKKCCRLVFACSYRCRYSWMDRWIAG